MPSASARSLCVLLERGQQQRSPLGVEADAGAAGRPQPTVVTTTREHELGQPAGMLAPAGDDHALATAVLDLDPRAAAPPLGVGSIQPLDNHPLKALLRGGRKHGLALAHEVPRHHQRRPVLDARAQLRYLRAVQRCPSPRDQALALVPFYAGARISEIVALDIDDVARSARKGILRILGKRERVRCVPLDPQLRAAITGWLAERADWPGGNDSPALFLNQRGQRLSVRGAHDIITGIAAGAGLDDDTTVNTVRYTFATTLVRGGTDLVIVAELLGHARLETTRIYTRPSAEDRTRALDLLLTDE